MMLDAGFVKDPALRLLQSIESARFRRAEDDGAERVRVREGRFYWRPEIGEGKVWRAIKLIAGGKERPGHAHSADTQVLDRKSWRRRKSIAHHVQFHVKGHIGARGGILVHLDCEQVRSRHKAGGGSGAGEKISGAGHVC